PPVSASAARGRASSSASRAASACRGAKACAEPSRAACAWRARGLRLDGAPWGVSPSSVSAIRWLHLTDLHAGMPGMGRLWQAVKADFWRDLERLHKNAEVGGIDVVFFTGDIAYSGKAGEYAQANAWLVELFAMLDRLGSKPVL